MHDIERFKSKCHKTRMDTLMKKVDKMDMSTSLYDNYCYAATNFIVQHYNMSDRITVLQTSIDFEYLFDKYETSDQNIHVETGWYDSNNIFQETKLADKVKQECEAGKIMFVYMDFHKYIPRTEDRITRKELYETHATGMIIYPSGPNYSSYSVYHFNPHGQAGAYCHEYNECISFKRRRSTKLDTGLDRYAIRGLVDSINRYFIANNANCPQLTYTTKKSHNYVGPNLQAGDSYGICYVFPTLLFIEICNNFKNQYVIQYCDCNGFTIENITKAFPSCEELLLTLNTNHIILLLISNYLPEIKQYIPDVGLTEGPRDGDAGTVLEETYLFQKIESVIEEKGTFFIKRLLGTVIEYLTQKSVRDMVALKQEPVLTLRT